MRSVSGGSSRSLVGRLKALVFLLLGICLVTAALSIWSIRETARNVERVNLAHRVYERYLSLSDNTHQLFKQYGDALLIGDRDSGNGERRLIEAVRADIAAIRRTIGREIEKVGGEEVEELELLAEIEAMINMLIREFETLIEGGTPETFSADWRRLSRILDDDIDRDFLALLTEALDEEASEVAETREEVAADIARYQLLAFAAMLAAVASAGAALIVLNRLLHRRMATLLAGVRAFAEGQTGGRVSLGGSDELSEIGETFDAMAARIDAENRRLEDRNTALEQAVAERTRRLETLLAEARRSENARRQMLSDVSHELRTPLTIIQGEADIALRARDPSPETYRDALSRAREAAGHTARIVDDLLFVARASEGRARLKPDMVDLVALLEERAEDPRGSITLALGSASAEVRADPTRLRQVLAILLENARHYGGGGGEIVLGLDRTTEGWRISVADRGPGMSDAEKASAFERFYRGAQAAERYGEGVGLGLPVAKSIVEAHGGTLSLEDREGGGLVAAVVLPLKPRLRAVS